MKLVKFTDTGGHSVWVAPQWVVRVGHPPVGEYAGSAKTLITMSGCSQAVKEFPEDVVKLLEYINING